MHVHCTLYIIEDFCAKKPADHLVTVVLLGKQPEGRLDDSSTQTKHLTRSCIGQKQTM